MGKQRFAAQTLSVVVSAARAESSFPVGSRMARVRGEGEAPATLSASGH